MSATFQAKYSGPCSEDCGSRIHEGDYITLTDGGAAHAECVEFTERGSSEEPDQAFNEWNPEPLPDGPVTACPECWLTGPCDCGVAS